MSDDFEKELKTGFLEEASQLLVSAEQSFLSLESNPEDPAILESIFRIAHNIKGSSRAVGFDTLGAFTHEFESFLLKCKSGEIPLTRETTSLLLKCNDHVNQWITALKSDLQASLSDAELIREIQNFVPNAKTETVSPSTEAVQEVQEPDAPVVSVQQTPASPKPSTRSTPASGDESIRVNLSRVEKLLNYVGEMVILQSVLREQSHTENSTLLRKTVHQMGKVTKEIQDISMGLRMMPLKQTFQKMQRIVRDTSGALGKKVRIHLQGEDTEVDKTIIESLSDPLVHLIRNAVDHGVEKPEARISSGKSETGLIVLSARHQSGKLIIEIIDDGAGIDAERLRAKAREKGILSETGTLSDKEAYQLIFHSGFSTKEVVTDVSGRGVGMDVVRTNIEQLQGDIQIDTKMGKGTCFRIRLPLTLAIIDAMIVRSSKARYVIPLSHVHESLRPSPNDVHFVTGLGEVLSLRGQKIPLYRLASIFKPNDPIAPVQEATVIVIKVEEKTFAVLVDDIIGQSQVVIKQLGEEYRDLRGVSGIAILGDGKPALILELGELIKLVKSRNVAQNPTQRRTA